MYGERKIQPSEGGGVPQIVETNFLKMVKSICQGNGNGRSRTC